MNRTSHRLTIVATLILALSMLGGPAQAIERVAPKWSFVDAYGGATSPIGEYSQIASLRITDPDGRPVKIDAEQLYDPAFFLGFSYGQVVRGHIMASIGFRYTKVGIDDQLDFALEEPSINVYDLEFNANWQFMEVTHKGWTPYVGLGLHAGLVEQAYDAFENEYDGVFDAGLNFGAEVRVWRAEGNRAFITLASINNWTFAASDERPKNIHIGGGLRYYFK